MHSIFFVYYQLPTQMSYMEKRNKPQLLFAQFCPLLLCCCSVSCSILFYCYSFTVSSFWAVVLRSVNKKQILSFWARHGFHLMFRSLALVTEKWPRPRVDCATPRRCSCCLSPIFSGLLSHVLHPSSLHSLLQSGVGVCSQLLDRLRAAS